MIGDTGAHKKHIESVHWGNACFHERVCSGLSIMEEGTSNVILECNNGK
jgi:hypothetical protein